MSVKDFVKQWSNVVGERGRFKSGGTMWLTCELSNVIATFKHWHTFRKFSNVLR